MSGDELKKGLEVPEEPDVEDVTSEEDWAARGQGESRGSLTFYTAARQGSYVL